MMRGQSSSRVFSSAESSSGSEQIGSAGMAPKKKKSAGGKKKTKDKKSQPTAADEMPGHPEDILPLVLTSVTQELFGCIADEDVTGESPYKLLKKDNIIKDIKKRAAVSDFSPAKQNVLEYPDDELLLVFDRTFTYGQCFYLVLTPEAKDRILKPPEPQNDVVLEDEVKKPPEPKGWISLGSEREIEEESVKETRKKLHYTFSRVRRMFGAPVCFSDRNAADDQAGFIECVSYQDSTFSIKRMQGDCGMQAVPKLQDNSAQTLWKIQRNIFTQYTPRELSTKEKESILQSESLKNFCISVTPRILRALQQEEIMNVFKDDWKALVALPEAEDRSGSLSKDLMIYQDFADPEYTQDKKITSINWHPTIEGVLAVAVAEKKKWSTSVHRPSLILFYTFANLFQPQLLLEAPEEILAFEFCPSDPNIIAGGCINGQIVLWDISAHVTHLQAGDNTVSDNTDKFDLNYNKEIKTPVVHYCAVSALEHKHKAPITDVQWLPSTFEVTNAGLPVKNQHKMSVQVLTCSLDCTLMFWDMQVLKWFNESVLERKQNVDQKTLPSPSSVPSAFGLPERTWKPLFRVSLPKIDTSGEYVPLKFSLEHYTCIEDANEDDERSEVNPGPGPNPKPSEKTVPVMKDVNTKLYIGTEDGEIVYTDWTLEKDESGQSATPLHCYNIHHWMVNTVQRSPFFQDIILTVGEWNFAIWREGVMEGPIILSPNCEQSYTAACWCLSRPAVFFVGKGNGSIEVWNLLEKSSEAVHIQEHVTSAKITCMKPWTLLSRQHFLAVTDDQGLVRLLEIPKSFHVCSKRESLRLQKYFELQEDRLKDLLRREKLWGKEKKEDELPKMAESSQTLILEENEEVIMKEYNEYLQLEKCILADIGLLPATGETDDN